MTIEELADQIDRIENAMVKEEFGMIDSFLEYIADGYDDLDSMENAELVVWVRATYLARYKLPHWVAARDRIEQILNERDLDGKHILRGLYE